MNEHIGKNSTAKYILSSRISTRGSKHIFEGFEKEIPVYDSQVLLWDLIHAPENIQPAYILKGSIHRRGEIAVYLKDESLAPVWEKEDLVLLKAVGEEALVAGELYYFVLADKRELAGRLTHNATYFIFTPENSRYQEERVQPGDEHKMYKIMGGLKKEEALRERKQDK